MAVITGFSASSRGVLSASPATTTLRNAAALRRMPARPVKGLVPVRALFGGGKKSPPPPPPPLYQPPAAAALDQRERLKLGTALRNIGWLSFWSQLVLSSVSAVILLFSTGVSSSGRLSINPMDVCTLLGVGGGLVTSFLSWTWIRAGRRLGMGQEVKLQQVLGSVLVGTNLNLAAMGATILGLQATVGALLGKTLTSAAGAGYYRGAAPPPVAFDVFSVQACANTIMAHFAGLVLAQWLLRVVQKHLAAEEEAAYAPSAPLAPY